MDDRILIRLMTSDNKMDPFLWAALCSLLKLTDIEEMLIARVHVVMKVCRLSKGNVGCKGNTLSVEQDIDMVIQKLPMIPEELPIFAARKPNPSNANGCKDFKINKQNIMTWLKFLKENNKNCMDINIDEHALDHLPNEGPIFDNLRHCKDNEEEIESNMGGNAPGPE